ncbi:signal peptidase I [Candidatus Nitrosacidococcus sp. I8]|uniref:signal peptidase I n=1 Tax=Candidatus Nitrosacidococcus sp. I8 TaxID=2942908 RepID=UPI002226D05F|nr:signal peptidase I [Candidatus Nitrosacidococcus sp. I8]CAH9019037.1 Signal peptidase I [Candidatus Nitrosacidococcus sp. I8]
MYLDFPTVMVIAATITGTVWALDSWLWAPARRRNMTKGATSDTEKTAKDPILVEYARSFFPIIVVVLVLRSFLVEPFRIPSGSMIPTLMVGDFILVNKFIYGIRLPAINKKIIALGEPKQGDVVVFRYPKNPRIDYIKRVIGLPGDKISYHNKTIYINDQPMKQDLIGPYFQEDTLYNHPDELRIEYLGAQEHQIVVAPNITLGEGEYEVPEGHYFMMGDNRDRSNDSRFWGVVPEENLIGKAFMVWMSWDWDKGGVILDRIGNKIK